MRFIYKRSGTELAARASQVLCPSRHEEQLLPERRISSASAAGTTEKLTCDTGMLAVVGPVSLGGGETHGVHQAAGFRKAW